MSNVIRLEARREPEALNVEEITETQRRRSYEAIKALHERLRARGVRIEGGSGRGRIVLRRQPSWKGRKAA